LFGGTAVVSEGTPKSKKHPTKLGEIDLNRSLVDGNSKSKSKGNGVEKDKEKGKDRDNEDDNTSDSASVTPELKPATSIFSNLFTNQSKTTARSSAKHETNEIVSKGKYAEKDTDDDAAATAAQNSKRKYTQFGYFSHRPSCVADSDFVTVVISGIEISDLFYVDRLWSPKPYLEISVGKSDGDRVVVHV
jgi:hypothetical protein